MNFREIFAPLFKLDPMMVAIWTVRISGALLITALLVWSLRRLTRVQNRLAAFLQRTMTKKGGGLVARSADVLYRAIRTVLGLVRLAVSLTLVYAWLASVTILLDPSRWLFNLVVSPLIAALATVGQALIEFIPNLAMLVVIVAVARFATRMAQVLAEAIMEGEIELAWLEPDAVEPTRRLVTIGIWLIALVMGAPYLPGSHSRAFQGIGIVLGVLVSLGSGSAAGNLLAGLVMLYSREFRPGDRVKIGDTVGDVESMGAFQTRIRTIKDEEVAIPNAVVQQSQVINYSRYAREQGVQVWTRVTIGYETPWRKVHELLIAAAIATDGIERVPKPYVLQRTLGDYYVTYELCAFTKAANRLHIVEGELNQAILDSFFQEGVELCSPQFTSFRDGSRVQIPPEGGVRPKTTLRPEAS
jgi:small-conductance mechanosensitive channel